MAYGRVYVARIAFGAKDLQTVKAFVEAESFPGPSLLLAYSHCIAHGYDMAKGAEQQKLAVETGHWPLLRYDPRRLAEGKSALQLDSPPPKGDLGHYMRQEARYRWVENQNPDRFRVLLEEARDEARQRYALYEQLAAIGAPAKAGAPRGPGAPTSSPEVR